MCHRDPLLSGLNFSHVQPLQSSAAFHCSTRLLIDQATPLITRFVCYDFVYEYTSVVEQVPGRYRELVSHYIRCPFNIYLPRWGRACIPCYSHGYERTACGSCSLLLPCGAQGQNPSPRATPLSYLTGP